jgi:NAD+ synthase (glutamine-hydrolysing)
VTRLRLALCQIDSVVGDITGNTERVAQAMKRSESLGADLAVFPELMLTGYPPEDLLLKPSFVTENLAALHELAGQSGACAAVVGYVEEDGELYNAAAVMAEGRLAGSFRKNILPNYGVFDERRYFAPGGPPEEIFSIGGVRVGVVVCEDAWSPAGPVAALGAGGAELVVVINASPYRKGALSERRRMLATRAADASVGLVYLNLVGGQDELVFDGGSMVFDNDGTLVFSLPQFEEHLEAIELELEPAYRKRLFDPRGQRRGAGLKELSVTGPTRQEGRAPGRLVSRHDPQIARVLEPAEEVYRALVTGTRDYFEKGGFKGALVSLSGGIDSSLVAAIAVDALGPGRVHGVLLPSRYSSDHSLSDAEALVTNLGIKARTIPIEAGHVAMAGLLSGALGRAGETLGGLTDENLQARLRGSLVMGLSNELGWLVLTTGNKSEMAVGYATLYGDMAGGFAVIKDVPKTLVYELARWRNEVAGADLIPANVLSKAPSAELRPDQKDEDSLPSYEVLDPILEGYVERDLTFEELVAESGDEELVSRVLELVDRAEYKRRQAPPGPRVTTRGFGKDRRMPITNRFSNRGTRATSRQAKGTDRGR